MNDVLSHIRDGCAAVAEQARSVRIDSARLEALARELAAGAGPAVSDPAHRRPGDAATTLAWVLTLDAVNFGSGWFPLLRKRPGMSGYFTLASALEERFERCGAFSAAELVRMDAASCEVLFGQSGAPAPVAELMELFARALRELGGWLDAEHGGRFEGPVEAAGGSAARLVEELAQMPLYRDVSHYHGLEVPFYKRAQLSAADLARAFGGEGFGSFHDLDRLTLFADNLVPHVLRRAGVLVYRPELAERIDREMLLPAGCDEEVEIRACAVHAVERCVASIRAAGGAATAQQLDYLLWSRGQDPRIKAHPRHRTRTASY